MDGGIPWAIYQGRSAATRTEHDAAHTPDGKGEKVSGLLTPDEISEKQRQCRPPYSPRIRTEYRRYARWLELEVRRGYPSASETARYARNMRWAAELAGLHGPGTWLELIAHAGVENPESSRARKASK